MENNIDKIIESLVKRFFETLHSDRSTEEKKKKLDSIIRKAIVARVEVPFTGKVFQRLAKTVRTVSIGADAFVNHDSLLQEQGTFESLTRFYIASLELTHIAALVATFRRALFGEDAVEPVREDLESLSRMFEDPDDD